MSNWKERIGNAFSARSAKDSEDERIRLNAEIARKDSEYRGRKLRKEHLDTFKSKVDPVLAKSALAKAREVWRVGRISEKIPDEENLRWVFELTFSRRGKANYWAGGSMESSDRLFQCNGRWTDSLDVTFEQDRNGHGIYIRFQDGHYFNPNETYDSTGRSHGDGGEEKWHRVGEIRILLRDPFPERGLIEDIVLRFCEERILNKQLPRDYKY